MSLASKIGFIKGGGITLNSWRKNFIFPIIKLTEKATKMIDMKYISNSTVFPNCLKNSLTLHGICINELESINRLCVKMIWSS